MMHDMEQFIDLKYLKAVHINDSRGDLAIVLLVLLDWLNNFNTYLNILLELLVY